MAIDMVLVFNQLTRQELADCTLFENILDLHYEKFKYFYSIIEDLSLDKVQKIHCQEQESELELFIQFENKKDRDGFAKELNSYVSKSKHAYYKECFKLSISKEGNTLNISIENKNICREEDIYEDRFNTH